MAMTRLDSDERRKAIVAAAVPLFARKGFAGATTKELAEAAAISEALLFRHFPSKKHLYDEILRLGCEGHPALECLAALAPSTFAGVHITHLMVRYFLLGGGADRREREARRPRNIQRERKSGG
jgi:TetR/AcrR family transcriptional regulator, transcriptional repressor of aconitase